MCRSRFRSDAGDGGRLDQVELIRHAVMFGMTGSGKTGLATVLLEELQLAGVPTLVIDPGGAMAGLLLRFPRLNPLDFEPWLETHPSHGATVCQQASDTANLWRSQLGTDQDRLTLSPDRPGSSRPVPRLACPST